MSRKIKYWKTNRIFYCQVTRNMCKTRPILAEICTLLRKRNLSLSLIAAITNYYSREKNVSRLSRDAQTRTYRSTKRTTKSVDGTDTDGGKIGVQGRREKRKKGEREEKEKETREESEEDVTSCEGTNGAGVVRGLEM